MLISLGVRFLAAFFSIFITTQEVFSDQITPCPPSRQLDWVLDEPETPVEIAKKTDQCKEQIDYFNKTQQGVNLVDWDTGVKSCLDSRRLTLSREAKEALLADFSVVRKALENRNLGNSSLALSRIQSRCVFGTGSEGESKLIKEITISGKDQKIVADIFKETLKRVREQNSSLVHSLLRSIHSASAEAAPDTNKKALISAFNEEIKTCSEQIAPQLTDLERTELMRAKDSLLKHTGDISSEMIVRSYCVLPKDDPATVSGHTKLNGSDIVRAELFRARQSIAESDRTRFSRKISVMNEMIALVQKHGAKKIPDSTAFCSHVKERARAIALVKKEACKLQFASAPISITPGISDVRKPPRTYDPTDIASSHDLSHSGQEASAIP